MKPKTLILMVVAVGCGLGASYMTSKLLAERNAKQEVEPTVPVLVAKVRVPSVQVIKEPEKYFEIKQFPQSVAPKRALASFEEIKEQRLKLPLDEGKSVTQDDLVNKESATLEYQLQPGQVAVAIKVNSESLVGGFVLPGTRVNVIHTTRGSDATAKIILQNMLVLAVDTIKERGETQSILGQTVTLAATPEEATRLSLASSNGELRLLLKSASDTKVLAPVVVTTKDLEQGMSESGEGAVNPGTRRASTPPVALPELPADKRATAQAGEESMEPVKPPKPHVLTIRNGLSVDKTVFRPERVDDEVVDDPNAGTTEEASGEKSEEKSKPAPSPKKPTPAPAATKNLN